MTQTVLQTFKNNLPQKPYCTDELQYGLKIRSAETAIKKRFIQPNKPTDLRWLVYDVDRPTAHFDWDDVRAPAPNMTIMNPENGHCHLLYGLEVPVYTQMQAKKNPIRYAASVDVALTKLLQADENYAKLICKNPLHNYWDTKIWREESYDLAELADNLDLEPYRDLRRKLPAIGLGRNCDLFDMTRFYAYREIRKPIENYLFDEMYGQDDFVDRCICYARSHNQFTVALPDKECVTIGKSVGKWVYLNMSPAGFLEWCHKRARYGNQKSIEVRAKRSDERAIQAQLLADKGYRRGEIAELLKVNEKTIQRMKLIYKMI